jgi:hypothetical protein
MRLVDLRKTLHAADPAAVLVAGRVLRRVIQQVYNLPTFLWKVPHADSFVVDRHVLFRHVEQEELDLEPDQRLPATVILLPRPEDESDQKGILLRYWRRLFHARVHLALEEQRNEKALPAQHYRTRIEQLGLAEFEEIHTVLQQEHFLKPKPDDGEVYIEFAAVYLELKFFAPNLLKTYFPGIQDFERIDRLLREDLDFETLYNQTRLAGASDPQPVSDTSSDLSHERYWAMMQEADAAANANNVVRAALLRSHAARIAPAAQVEATREGARGELRRLTSRLQDALQLGEAEADEWFKDLQAVLDKADPRHSSETAFLYDLQRVCLDFEQDVCTVDPVEWMLSGFKRPIKRPLSGQRPVRILKHLRHAAQRLTTLRLSDEDRHHLTALLKEAITQGESRLRDRFRTVLRDAFQDVDLAPATPPEKVASDKMIEELLDRVVAFGYLTFSDLRDAISRNQLKMPDLADPQQFIRGDPLLRLDRRLAILMDGIYRPSEIYMRLLERMSALSFGTRLGRAVTRYFTIPFGGAFLAVEAIELLFTSLGAPPMLEAAHWLTIFGVGIFLLALIHVESFRQQCVELGSVAFRPLRTLVAEVLPRYVPLAAIRRALLSWPAQLIFWYIIKPGVACLVVYAFAPWLFASYLEAIVTFFAVFGVLSLRPVTMIEEFIVHAVVQFYADLRAGLLPGLIRLIIRGFKQVTDTLEYVLFSVDEWLRFRSGDGQVTLAVRAVLSVLWYPISYLARFYMVVLIEPGINPLKFPISSVAYKFILPFQAALIGWFAGYLAPIVGHAAAYVIVFPNVWLLADAFGFLFWETKENWSLYRANRSGSLRPVAIGPHGETLRGLLRPGFHSGTIPRLFAKLRAAEVEASTSGNWHAARSFRANIGEIEHVVRQFVAREFVQLLLQGASWKDEPVRVGRVELSYNRIRVEVANEKHAGREAWLEFEERAGWFIAGVPVRGWLDTLTDEQRRAFTTALASLYKLAGVTLVREQVQAQLTPAITSFDVTPELLILSIDGNGQTLTYDLSSPGDRLRLHDTNGVRANDRPVLEKRRIIFADTPISRQQWSESWQRDQEGKGHPPLSVEGEDLVLLGSAEKG